MVVQDTQSRTASHVAGREISAVKVGRVVDRLLAIMEAMVLRGRTTIRGTAAHLPQAVLEAARLPRLPPRS
jgi:hypothetical protein